MLNRKVFPTGNCNYIATRNRKTAASCTPKAERQKPKAENRKHKLKAKRRIKLYLLLALGF
jgi:hypothetical protein